MAIPLIVPVLAGAGALAAFIFGSSKTASAATMSDPVASKQATEALKRKDYQSAAANALASKSEATVREVARGMVAAGKSEEAASLASAFKKLMEASKPKKTAKKKSKKKALPAAPVRTTSTPARPVQAPARPAPATSAPSQDPKFSRALALAKHLAGVKRGSENKALVKAFQAENGLTSADGLYGPASAQTLWNVYAIVPPNPFYWPRAPKTAAALAQYQKFLDEIVKNDPSAANAVAKLKPTVGR